MLFTNAETQLGLNSGDHSSGIDICHFVIRQA